MVSIKNSWNGVEQNLILTYYTENVKIRCLLGWRLPKPFRTRRETSVETEKEKQKPTSKERFQQKDIL